MILQQPSEGSPCYFTEQTHQNKLAVCFPRFIGKKMLDMEFNEIKIAWASGSAADAHAKQTNGVFFLKTLHCFPFY